MHLAFILDVTDHNDLKWSKYVLPLLEAQCEASLHRHPDHVYSSAIAKALNCPNDCFDHGECRDECICHPGYIGHDCSVRTSLEIVPQTLERLCVLSLQNCHNISVHGNQFDPNGTCHVMFNQTIIPAKYVFVNKTFVSCLIDKLIVGEMKIVIKDQNEGQEDHFQYRIYDDNCEECKLIGDHVKCIEKQYVCQMNGTCLEQGQTYPGDECLQCFKGQWIPKSNGVMSVATSELNKKFKVIQGDMFSYNLPKSANDTEFELISGPYGAQLLANGTISWRAVSNLIADAWSELFIIKAKGVCDDLTLIEVTVHVVTCQCTNEAPCVLIQDVPTCLCKPGFRGDKCDIMEDPCMVPRCNFGKCIPDGINFQCICDPGYTGSLCTDKIQPKCICYDGLECDEDANCNPCPEGMTGDGKICTVLRPCDHDPCFEGVECFPIGDDDFVCGHCPPGLTGNGKKCYESTNDFIEHLCDDDETNPCFDKSMCKVDNSKVVCKACPRGFRGDGITCIPVKDQDPCNDENTNPCYPGSKCQVVNGIVTCGACPKFTIGDGRHCERVQNVTDMECPPGQEWENGKCVLDVKPCDPNPCYEGVQCELQYGQAVCGSCPIPLVGDGFTCNLKSLQDFCSSNPCFPGVECTNLEDKYSCGPCPEGFQGDDGIHCSPGNDPCHHNPCYPGVSCVTVWKGRQAMYTCGLCPDGMVGDGMNCTFTDPCESQPCHPGVKCISNHDTGDYQCAQCPIELVGDGKVCRSKKTPCEPNPCHPGLRCSVVNDMFQCEPCPEGTIGDGFNCEDVNDCRNDSCFPGVKCHDLKAPKRGYKCASCPVGYSGDGISCRKIETSFIVPCPDVGHCYPGVDCILNNATVPYITCGKCLNGYVGDGIRCEPICSNCDQSSEVCLSPELCQSK